MPNRMVWFSLAALLWAVGAPKTASAQTASLADWRRELGLRVQSAEAAYLAAADDVARARAVDPMDRAVRAFFRGDVAEVARQLELARLAARGEGAGPIVHPAARFAPRLESLLLDGATPTVFLHIETVGGGPSGVAGDQAAPFRLHWRMQEDRAALRRPPIEGPFHDLGSAAFDGSGWVEVQSDALLAFEVVLPPPAQEAQMFALELAFDAGPHGVMRRCVPIERIPHLRARLGKCAELLIATHWPTTLGLERDTALALLERLEAASHGDPGETRWSAAHALAELERCTAAPIAGRQLAVGVAAPGDYWLARGQTRARWYVPPGLRDGERAPLVLALHGAGGSENLFFDGHGGGRILELAAERNWFVLAPRLGLFAALDFDSWIAELSARWPVDRTSLFLVGHSMGGAAALRELRRSPDRYLAAALLGGGGGAVAGLERLHGVALLVAAGERDFGLVGARRLADALAGSGHPRSTFAVLPRSEHLLVVPLALPAAFALFDGALLER